MMKLCVTKELMSHVLNFNMSNLCQSLTLTIKELIFFSVFVEVCLSHSTFPMTLKEVLCNFNLI